MPTRVSVIIPTYNRADKVKASIESVLSQSFVDYELIVVDDGSTDDTEAVVRSMSDSRLKYIKHDFNQGASAARNTGIECAESDFIAFQDSDDLWFPEKLAKQFEVLRQASDRVGVVYSAFWYEKDGCKKKIPDNPEIRLSGDIHQELLKGNFITTQAALVKKECFNQVGGFDDRMPRLQDWELFLRISKYYEFEYIDQPLLKAFYSPESITGNQKSWVDGFARILDKHKLEYRDHKELLASHYMLLSHEAKEVGEWGLSWSCLMKALSLNPRGFLGRLFRENFSRQKVVR